MIRFIMGICGIGYTRNKSLYEARPYILTLFAICALLSGITGAMFSGAILLIPTGVIYRSRYINRKNILV